MVRARRGVDSPASRPVADGFRRACALAAVLVFLQMILGIAPAPSAGRVQRWTFDEDPVGEPPRGWEVLLGTWIVRADEGGNRVLAQVGAPGPGPSLPAILAPGPPAADLRARVRLRADGAGPLGPTGLILRWRDHGTMTRVQASGSPCRIWIERVRAGRSSLRAGYMAPLRPDGWNVLGVTARGDWLNLFFNGRFLGGLREDGPVAGRVGLMAGPGGRVLLDDLEVEVLREGARTG